jgi:hypothetical protein
MINIIFWPKIGKLNTLPKQNLCIGKNKSKTNYSIDSKKR